MKSATNLLRTSRRLLATMLVVASAAAFASTTGRLADAICAHPDTILAHGFEAQASRYVEPSNGSGGLVGASMRNVSVPGFGIHSYYRYVPDSYDPARPMPMLMLLHGTGGPTYPANTAAYALIHGSGNPVGTVPGWKVIADAAQIIIIAPIGSGANGGWVVPSSPTDISDYDAFRAMLFDMKSAYNIDASRIHGWGYSSGGSVMNDLVFGPYSSGIDIDTFAGFGNWAGGLDGLACNPNDEPSCVQLLTDASRKIPVDLHVGISDTVARPHVLADYNRLQNAGWQPSFDLWYQDTPNGHEYNPAYFPEIWDHLCPFQRLP